MPPCSDGQAWGLRSPVETFSDTIYADVRLEPGAALPLDTAHEQRAIDVVSGAMNIGNDRFPSGQLLVLRPDKITVRNAESGAARLALIGGETIDGPRYICLNFVSSRPERIEQAKADWKSGRFDTVQGDAEEFILLPDAHEVTSHP
jgi:redox-sensitive bicupin YhaK (pirin superfamily)